MHASSIIVIVLVLAVTVLGFVAANWRRTGTLRSHARVGAGRAQLRHRHLVVSDRRRSLHRLHVHRGARARLRRRADGVLCRALHDRRLSVRHPGADALLERGAQRAATSPPPTSCAIVSAIAGSRSRSPSPASSPCFRTSRCSSSVCKSSSCSSAAYLRLGDGNARACNCLRAARRLHVYQRPARPRADRVRQGHADLHHDHLRGRCDHAHVRRMGRHLRCGRQSARGQAQAGDPAAPAAVAVLRLWHAGVRIGARALHLSALDHVDTLGQEPDRRATQHGAVADLLALARDFLRCSVMPGSPPASKSTNPQLVVPVLFARIFPDWFAGVAYAAIVIGALVPAAIMAIGGANLFASNIFRQFSAQRDSVETAPRRCLTLVICLFALLFVIFIRPQFAIGFQFLGGAWILQTFPAFVIGLYTNWFNPKALLLGWVVGIAAGTYMAVQTDYTAAFPLHLFGGTLVGYGPFYALLLNLIVSVIATPLFNAAGSTRAIDATTAADYA